MSNKKKEAYLESESGYMMPFAQAEDEDTQVLLPYGQQTNPLNGKEFNHTGVDFAVNGKELYAMATGVIIGVGQEAVHENYIVAKYGNYEVTYGHIAEAYCTYGGKVKAGDVIARSGNILHIGVRLGGQYVDPAEFLAMVYANIQNLAALGIQTMPTVSLDGKEIHTKYDEDKDEILMMMQRWLPVYLTELYSGRYASPKRIEAMLRNSLEQAAQRDYFYEKIPDVGNPLGLSSKSLPLVEKFQNLLLEDFLIYMASRHQVYPPSWSDSEKKKLSCMAAEEGVMVDPLARLVISAESYDIERAAYFYYNNAGTRCWTTARFNRKEEYEKSIEISLQMAMQAYNHEISRDEWLARFYPKQMTACSKALEQARRMMLGL